MNPETGRGGASEVDSTTLLLLLLRQKHTAPFAAILPLAPSFLAGRRADNATSFARVRCHYVASHAERSIQVT